MNDLSKSDLAKVNESTSQNTTARFDIGHFPQAASLPSSLNELFSEQTYEDKTVKRAKEILGEQYTTDDAKELIASFEYLLKVWMEEYERKTFDDKTLKELLADL